MAVITEVDYRHLSAYIKKHLGIHLGAEKKSLVQSRLQPTIEQKKLGSFSAYYDYLSQDATGQALRELAERLTTNHTYFNREAEHFVYLQNHVLPSFERTLRSRDLRVWSAGCSYGQEPYTLAMILSEFFGPLRAQWDTKVLATDLSPKALAEARAGIYKKEDVYQLPERWRRTYFRPAGPDTMAVVPDVKNEVIFRSLNLIHPLPFKHPFHIIFCRNVMIYFDAALRAQLIRKFYDVLAPGGYLFIGHSESLTNQETGFQYVMPAVYRK